VDLNVTIVLSTDDDDLFESCLSSPSHTDTTGATYKPYFEPLRLSSNDGVGLHHQGVVRGPAGLQHPVSLRNGDHATVNGTYATNPQGHGRRSGMDIAPAVNADRSDCRVVESATDSESDCLLNETLSCLSISTDEGTVGESWLSSDLTAVSSLSDLSSTCSRHSVRIERQPVAAADNDDDHRRCSLVETILVPTNHDDPAAAADTTCQRGDLECSYLSDDRSFHDDWKTTSRTDHNCVADEVPASIQSLSAAELRAELVKLGETPGPVTETTRRLHEQRLVRLMSDNTKLLKSTTGSNLSSSGRSSSIFL